MFNGKRPPTVIRTVSVQVKKDKPSPKPTPSPTPSSSSKHRNLLKSSKSSSHLRPPKPKSSRPSTSPAPAVKPHTSLKRKTPQDTVLFDTDSESDADEDGTELAKRMKQDSKSPRNASVDLIRRDAFVFENWDEDKEAEWPIMHGESLTNAQDAKNYRSVGGEEAKKTVVSLKYPSNCPRERFELVIPHDASEYSPLNDITATIEMICKYYFPGQQSEALLDDNNGITRRLKRAVDAKSVPKCNDIIEEFNRLLRSGLKDKSIQSHLSRVHSIDPELSSHVITQIYSRVVSPQVSKVREYENGTSNVYGEILPPFATRIFREAGLNAGHVFVDMGSGVGNVVLQAALETGAQAWGIEMMANPAELARQQLAEFEARCRRYSIKPGAVTLIEGNFLENQPIRKALATADVVLINNKAFLPELNDSILHLMLDLKEGCKVLSLKSFVPVDWKMKARNVHDPRNLFRVEQRWYPSQGMVSWTDNEGDWFVMVKDSRKYRAFVKQMEH